MKKYRVFLILFSVLAFFNACQKELSFENGSTPSLGALQSDLTGDCLPKTVAGVYEAGKALDATNYIDVTVDVIQAGSYLIYTDTTNGIYFRATGIFTATGTNTVRLKGNGTPVIDGISNFVVTYGTSQCTVAVTILPAGSATPAVFTLSAGTAGECMSAVVSGTYTTGVAVTPANQVVIDVNVTTAGTYNVTTSQVNGISFSGSGTLATGAQTITLAAAGTPGPAGTTTIPVTAGSSTCNFPVTVAGPAVFTVNCGSAVVTGTLTAGTPLTATGNTIDIPVNVTTPGTYNITGTVNNITFAKSGTFATAGAMTITLAGSGTPTTSGSFNLSVTGGSAACDVPLTVNAAAGAATFTVNCGTAVVNGDYLEGLALDASNTVDIQVNVTVAGTYNISGTINNMTFAKSGTFATTGTTTVTLAGTGTPTADGTFNVPITAGSTPCNFSVIVDPTMGTWQFTQGTTTYKGVFTDTEIDNTTIPGFTTLFCVMDIPSGEYFEFDLLDANGTFQANETYDMSTAMLGTNTGYLYYEKLPKLYEAGVLAAPGTTVVAKITTHNTATKTISGTFSGKAYDENDVLRDLTSGTFTVTYP